MSTTFDPNQTPIASIGYQNSLNILDNGGFEVWQRGTTFNSISSAAPYSADRWKWQQSNVGMVANITQESTTIHSGTFSMKVVITNSGTSSGLLILQFVENFKAYASRQVSFSIWLNTTLANVVPIINDGNVAFTGTAHPGDGQWHQVTVTGTLSSNPSQLAFYIQQNTPATGTIYLDDAMAVVGSQPITFVPTNSQIDLARCQRYYEKNYDQTVAPGTATQSGDVYFTGASDENSVIAVTISFKVEKRTTPTVVFYDTTGASGQWRYARNGVGSTAVGMNLNHGASNGFIAISNSVGAAFVPTRIEGFWVASADL